MKNKISIIISAILIIMVCVVLITQTNNQAEEQNLYYEQSTYTVSGTMTVEFVNDTLQAINLIPSDLLSDFFNDGWQFIICNSKEAYYGLCDTKNKAIYIYYQQHDDTLTIADTVLHEFGHYYDYSNGWISSSDEIMKIYNERLYADSKRNDDYCYTNPQELYACIFRDKYSQ